MSGISGDYGRLTATIAALKQLTRVPARVAAVAAPRIEAQVKNDTRAQRDPYAEAYAPHAAATTKRWGAHPILDLTGAGIASISARPMGGAGIALTADEHMTFTQAGTGTQPVRAIFPNNPSLPTSWRRILERATKEAIG